MHVTVPPVVEPSVPPQEVASLSGERAVALGAVRHALDVAEDRVTATRTGR